MEAPFPVPINIDHIRAGLPVLIDGTYYAVTRLCLTESVRAGTNGPVADGPATIELNLESAMWDPDLTSDTAPESVVTLNTVMSARPFTIDGCTYVMDLVEVDRFRDIRQVKLRFSRSWWLDKPAEATDLPARS